MTKKERQEGEPLSPFTILWLEDNIKNLGVENLEDCLNTPTSQYQPAFRYQILGTMDYQGMFEIINDHLRKEIQVDLILADLILGELTSLEQVLANLRAKGLKDLPTIIFSGWQYRKPKRDIPLLDWIDKGTPSWEEIAARIQENILNTNNRRYFRKDLFGSPTGRRTER